MKKNLLSIVILVIAVSISHSQESEYSWMRIQSEPEGIQYLQKK